MGKNNEYLEISKQIVANIGGMDNIQGTAHCATRLRIVLKDNDLADIEKLEDIDKVKGAFIAGNQLQLILGAGTVNDVYEVFAEYTNTQNMSLGDLKEESAKRQNPLQAVIKALSDVFIGIMPALLAAALLMGITSVLGGLEVVKTHDTLDRKSVVYRYLCNPSNGSMLFSRKKIWRESGSWYGNRSNHVRQFSCQCLPGCTGNR